MGAADSKDIVILMFQYSVIVKGIERKLAEMEYQVTTVTEHLEEEAFRSADIAALFLFYLPGDIMEDTLKKNTVHHICEGLREKGKRMIIVGEKKYHDELIADIPQIRSFGWMDRPVDMNALEATVHKELNRAQELVIKKRILIVDDDPSYAKMVREWIKDEYRVDIVTAGMQAISFLLKVPENEKVDMILLDYEMPVVDGPQVLQMLRQDPATDHIPVIFLTGIGTKEAVSRVMSLKPEGYLLKSTTRADILDFLRKKV